ncbi:hypothetical protein EV401DRAFT_2008421 [Pisolithus croceorrhizus]|nr:hypothetical protein EV401DRAFT_2008421 [Pisolithus croceorrhizus]
MDEVNRARVELARLESVEQGDFRQMLATRRAVKAQRIHVEGLIRKRHLTIHCLPNELLVLIFGFVIARPRSNKPTVIGRYCRRRMACVSRRWKDIILATPTLWNDIYLGSRDDRPTLVSQLKRSQGLLLDITIMEERTDFVIRDLLPYLRPTTYRWRSLYISSFVHAAIHELSKLEFPSLVDLHIKVYHPELVSLVSQDLLPRAPTLKHLTLRRFTAANDFLIASPLKTLELVFHYKIPSSLLSRIPTASLTVLSITGSPHDWLLEPNSINFPLLEKLVLLGRSPYRFLETIVAPKLQYCHLSDAKCLWEHIGLFRKFSRVHYLDLVFYYMPPSAALLDRAPFYQPFPNTRHAKFSDVRDLRFVITSIPFSGNLVESQKPADGWASLERLTIPVNLGNCIEDFDLLLQWLETRQEFGLPKLHVKLTGCSDIWLDPTELYILCSKLRCCCILELECIRLSLGKYYAVAGKEGQLGLDPYLPLSFVDPAFVQRRFFRWKREESESESEDEDE